MGKYITVEEVLNYRPPNSTELPDWSDWVESGENSSEDLEALIASIEQELECGTGKIFNKEINYEMILDGTGLTKLFPKSCGMEQPMLVVHSVERVKFNGDVEELYVEGKHYVFDPKKPYYLIWNKNEGGSARDLGHCGARWPKGQRNIRVVADIGMEEVPADVKSALCRWIVAEALSPEDAGFIAVSGESGKVQEVWEDYTVTYGRSTEAEKRKNRNVSNISGYLPVDRVLSRYVNLVGMFSVI